MPRSPMHDVHAARCTVVASVDGPAASEWRSASASVETCAATPRLIGASETHEDVRQWVEGCTGSDVRIRFVRKLTDGQACDRDWRKHWHRNRDRSRAGIERLTRLDVRS